MALLKYIFLALMVTTTLLAKSVEEELIVNVLKLLKVNEHVVRVYEQSPSRLLTESGFVSRVSECKDADLVYGEKFDTLPFTCKNLPRFSTEYEHFQKDERVIGAFYWRKGRPQLRFNENRCKNFNIKLPPELVQYAY